MKKSRLYCGLLTALTTMAIGLPMTVQAAPTDWSCTTSLDDDGDILLDFENVQVYLPGTWDGLCQMGTDEYGVNFYQKKSRKLWTQELGFPNGGWLFSVQWSDDFDFLELPSYEIIGNGSGGCYYIVYPTDLQAYVNDTEAYDEFRWMLRDVSWVADSITLKEEDTEHDNASEYILPQSSSEYISEQDLKGMDADMIQMAINEIYARHHRKFAMTQIQKYFDSKSWYEGYIEPENFDVSVMNQYESANIDLMVECMNKK